MADIEVLGVERPNGRVQSVRILAGNFEIYFARVEGKVSKVSVARYDKDRIHSPTELRVPDHLFRPAIKIARGIFSSSKV